MPNKKDEPHVGVVAMQEQEGNWIVLIAQLKTTTHCKFVPFLYSANNKNKFYVDAQGENKLVPVKQENCIGKYTDLKSSPNVIDIFPGFKHYTDGKLLSVTINKTTTTVELGKTQGMSLIWLNTTSRGLRTSYTYLVQSNIENVYLCFDVIGNFNHLKFSSFRAQLLKL